MLAGGCYWSSPGRLYLSPSPFLRAGGAHKYVTISNKAKRKAEYCRGTINLYVREELTDQITTRVVVPVESISVPGISSAAVVESRPRECHEAGSSRPVQGVVCTGLAFHRHARALEGVCGGVVTWSQPRYGVFAGVRHTYVLSERRCWRRSVVFIAQAAVGTML